MCVCVSHSVVSDSVTPMDCSPPGSSVHGILQARILQWVAMPSSRGSSWPRDQTHVSCTGRQILHYCTTSGALWEAQNSANSFQTSLRHKVCKVTNCKATFCQIRFPVLFFTDCSIKVEKHTFTYNCSQRESACKHFITSETFPIF